jgi:hypothetical protein
MSPTTRFVLDLICWFGTAGVLAYWGHEGWAMAVGIVGAVYLAFCWTILQKWLDADLGGYEDD